MAKIPNKLIERLLKEAGAKRVEKKAKKLIEKYIQDKLKDITAVAIKNSRHFGRKLIKKEDIEFAIRNLD